MTRRTKDDWRKLIEQQSKGDLSVAQFCKQHNLGQTYFYKRKSDLKKRIDKPQPSSFIKISKPTTHTAQSPTIKIHYRQTKFSLPTSISPTWLAEFIKALA